MNEPDSSGKSPTWARVFKSARRCIKLSRGGGSRTTCVTSAAQRATPICARRLGPALRNRVPYVNLVVKPVYVRNRRARASLRRTAGKGAQVRHPDSPMPPITFAALIGAHVCSGVGGVIWLAVRGGNSKPSVGSLNRDDAARHTAFLPASIGTE